MTVKQQGGIFGRNPTFNEVDTTNLSVSGDVNIDGSLAMGVASANTKADFLGNNTDEIPSGTNLYGYSSDSFLTIGNLNNASNAEAGIIFQTTNSAAGLIALYAKKTATNTAELIVRSRNGSSTNQELARFSSNGIAFPSGKGIDFSATSGTGTSELFDDYEEGSFTPVVFGTTTAGVGTYARQHGKYTKVGNFVTFNISIQLTAHTGTGNARISGMPFSINNGSNSVGAFSSYWANWTLPLDGNVQAYIIGTTVVLYMVNSSTDSAIAIDTNGALEISGSYFV